MTSETWRRFRRARSTWRRPSNLIRRRTSASATSTTPPSSSIYMTFETWRHFRRAHSTWCRPSNLFRRRTSASATSTTPPSSSILGTGWDCLSLFLESFNAVPNEVFHEESKCWFYPEIKTASLSLIYTSDFTDPILPRNLGKNNPVACTINIVTVVNYTARVVI